MISRPSPFQPPRLAAWLVDLFIPGEHAESIPGDLLEEFSEIAPRSGLTYARRWYWRQSIKTIGQLVRAGFRAAPWLIISATVGGFLLFGFGYSLPEKLIDAVLEFRRHSVIPYYTQREMNAHMFWYATVVMTGRLLFALIVGCIVAIVAKAREMVATLTLSFVYFAWNVVAWFNMARHWPDRTLPLPFVLTDFAQVVLIAMGGIVVRKVRRAARGRWHSSV
jgi:hypothetical protein